MLLTLFILLQILLVLIIVGALYANDPILWALSLLVSAVLMFSAFDVTENYTTVTASNTTVVGDDYNTAYSYEVLSYSNEETPLFYLNLIAGVMSIIMFFVSLFGIYKRRTGRAL